jgi:hypothetical protein
VEKLPRQPFDRADVDLIAACNAGLGLAHFEPSTYFPLLLRCQLGAVQHDSMKWCAAAPAINTSHER